MELMAFLKQHIVKKPLYGVVTAIVLILNVLASTHLVA
jgi:hypothetical protein